MNIWIFAHRWNRGETDGIFFENSIAACEESINNWADWFEIDVYVWGDWELYVFHEWSKHIQEAFGSDQDKLQQLIDSPDSVGIPTWYIIPKLEPFLDLIDRTDKKINIELKGRWSWKVIATYLKERFTNIRKNIIISAFDPNELKDFNDDMGEENLIETALLLHRNFVNLRDLCDEVQVNALHVLHWQLNSDTIAIADEKWLKIRLWNVNTREELLMNKLLVELYSKLKWWWGNLDLFVNLATFLHKNEQSIIDWIITDHPEIFVEKND